MLMEFLIVSTYQGNSLNEHMDSMQFVYVHPEFLIHVNCDSVEEYGRSIVHASTAIDAPTASRLVRQSGYLRNSGTVIFRHVRTLRTAILHFHMDVVCEQENRASGRFLVISRINHIEWQKDDLVANWIGNVEAKLALSCLLNKALFRDDMTYVSIPQHKLPTISDEIREKLCIMKCKFNVNVAYNSGTHRSLLMPKSLIPSHVPLEHHGYWSILSCGMEAHTVNFLEASEQMLAWTNTTNEELKSNLEVSLSKLHTAAETNRIIHELFPRCLRQENGTTLDFDVEFVIGKVIHVPVTSYRFRAVIVLVFGIEE